MVKPVAMSTVLGAMVEDRRYLVTRGRMYWTQIATPTALHGRYRKLVQKSLQTDSLREAQSRRWPVIGAFKEAWRQAEADPDMTAEEIDRIAGEELERLKRLEDLAR